jgi:hypothetical protein
MCTFILSRIASQGIKRESYFQRPRIGAQLQVILLKVYILTKYLIS